MSNGFLNTFYKKITRGSELTLFDAVCLLIAIPSTLIIKLVTAKPVPTFEKLDANFIESLMAAKTNSTSKTAKTATASTRSTTPSASIPPAVKPATAQTVKDVSTLLLGCGCGAATLKISLTQAKLVYKTVTGGVSVTLGSLSPGAVMEVFGMVMDALSIYRDLITQPIAPDTPGKTLIDISIAVKAFRLAANAIYMIVGKMGGGNPVADQVMLTIDVLSAIVNFALYSAVYAKQVDAGSKWEGYDDGVLTTAIIDNFLEVLAGIGYFTTATFKVKAPPVAAVGLVCFQAAAYGGAASKIAKFSIEYDRPLKS